MDSEHSAAPASSPAGSVSVKKNTGSARRGDVVKQATDSLVKRLPPFNEEAEQAVLAGLFHYAQYQDDIFASLTAEDFYVPRHSVIFQACYDLFQQRAPIEPQSLTEKLHSDGRLEEAGGMEYISTLYGNEVLGVNAPFYSKMVRNKSMQRRLINTCATILSNSYDAPYDSIDGLLDDAEHSIFTIAESTANTNDLISVTALRDAFFHRLELNSESSSALTGVTTGFAELDRMTGGLQGSDLIIVAARPSMGKTAFSLNMAVNAAEAGHKVAFFSLEMSAEQLESRLMSILSKVPLSKIRQPRYLNDVEWKQLYDAADTLNMDLFIDDTPSLRTLDLRAKARRMKARHGLDLILVDYLQLMRPSRPLNSRELEISEISRTLKALAKELQIPVIALSQLNRKLEERNDKRPMMSDLRESGAIEQDADVIMFLYRDDVYSKRKKVSAEGTAEPESRLLNSPTEVIIGKQRNGPVGTVKLLYRCEYTSFEDLAQEYEAFPSENGILQ